MTAACGECVSCAFFHLDFKISFGAGGWDRLPKRRVIQFSGQWKQKSETGTEPLDRKCGRRKYRRRFVLYFLPTFSCLIADALDLSFHFLTRRIIRHIIMSNAIWLASQSNS